MKLTLFKETDYLSAVKALFKELNVPMNYIADEPTTTDRIFGNTYKDNVTFKLINDVYFVGMVDDAAFEGKESLSAEQIKSDYDGLLIFGITLHQRPNNLLPTRSQLAEISRAFNREFKYTPVVLVFKYRDNNNEYIAFANTERQKYKQEWREGEKVGKISLLRDIDIANPHAGHQRILFGDGKDKGLRINSKVDTFAKLYEYWQEVFSVSILNKKFYKELQNWFFWAVKEVRFPNEPNRFDFDTEEKYKSALDEHKSKNVIRLLTRILFIWFIKEKNLIPEEIFDEQTIADKLIDDFTPQKPHGVFATGKQNSKYYRAILQNLFFATLNKEMGKRQFRKDKQHQNVTSLMRYKTYFKNPDYFLELMENVVPFMNGGLFECLDKPHPDKKGKNGGDIIVYIDGFSDRNDNSLVVPDYLFFDMDEEVDISDVIGIKANAYKNAKARGLIEILKSYKFTITENTPIEEDVALDPELLGKVFENLLASYNPETKTTARKQTGSFYTPREIVNYMVDESLIAYLKNAIKDWNRNDKKLDKDLHTLFSFDNNNPFVNEPGLQKQIIKALDKAKILDPAAGSGAFPMGILQKMVHVLHKVDPENKEWKQRQIDKVNNAIQQLEKMDDAKFREQSIKELKNQIKDIEDAFAHNELDYGRKLFLIENCIYGVDIQPIAIQIAKLRFFISLIVDQKVDGKKANLGIRPLPNLETKFVTANTLIGIEKPESGLKFDDEEIKNLEIRLKKIRHDLFSSKVPKRKRELRKEDKVIREKIAEKLKSLIKKKNREEIEQKQKILAQHKKQLQELQNQPEDVETYTETDLFGQTTTHKVDKKLLRIKNQKEIIKQIEKEIQTHENAGQDDNINKTARQLASWDPYDQNASSPFFDSEWMFGVNNGFDVVIGNPPYKQVPKGIFSKNQYPYSEGKDKGKQNLYKVFVEKAYNLVGNYGVNCLIVQSSLLGDLSASHTRDLILKTNIKFIIEFPKIAPTKEGQVFENVLQGTVVYLINRYKSKSYFKLSIQNDITTMNNLSFEILNSDVLMKFYPNYNFIPLVKKGEFDIIKIINKTKDSFLKDIYINQSQGDINLTSERNYFSAKISDIKLYRGKNVHRFYIDNDCSEYLKSDYKQEIVIKNKKNRYLVCQQITGTTDKYRIHFALTKGNEDFIFGNSVNKLLFPSKYNYALLGILNSKLIDWYFRKTSTNNHVNGYELDLLPIKSIGSYLNTISKLLEINYSSNILNRINNALVFNLYFPDHMKERGIDVLEHVEQDINEVMQGRVFEQLSDTEKEQIIEQLHQKWTDPDNEVVKRMRMFKQKSPDILKVIMES